MSRLISVEEVYIIIKSFFLAGVFFFSLLCFLSHIFGNGDDTGFC